MEKHAPLVIGHRGAMGHVTENTLASVQKALELGVDMIEIDVFAIASGEIVVFHDRTVDRLSNGGGPIEDYSWTDLQKLTLTGNHKIPLLREVLDLLDGNTVRLNIELKGRNTADKVNTLVQTYVDEKGWKLDKVVVSSFAWEELERIREINPDIPIAVLVEGNPLEALPMAQKLNAEAVNPYFKELDQEKAQAIRENGFKIYPWTVNDLEDIAQMKRLGVDGIITNFPERVK
ncbi:MAG: glycerophosphodiester phosphodiesterase family protein [Bacteroidota bacterium]